MIGWIRGRATKRREYPPGPAGLTIYVIGDIHGRMDCLRRAQAGIDRDKFSLTGSKRTLEVYIGDYVDRGPQSSAVLDNLVSRAEFTDMVAIRGNHEILMTSFLKGEIAFDAWRGLGGLETAMSYGLNPPRHPSQQTIEAAKLASRMPPAHLEFLATLRPFFVAPPYCFVHAGLRPGLPLERQTEQDMAWIREDFLEYRGSFGYIVVHGHTPVRDIEFHRHRINIDTGAYLSNRLSVLRIDARGAAPVELG